MKQFPSLNKLIFCVEPFREWISHAPQLPCFVLFLHSSFVNRGILLLIMTSVVCIACYRARNLSLSLTCTANMTGVWLCAVKTIHRVQLWHQISNVCLQVVGMPDFQHISNYDIQDNFDQAKKILAVRRKVKKV